MILIPQLLRFCAWIDVYQILRTELLIEIIGRQEKLKFIKEIFSNESEFSYLENVFDSKDYGHNYNVKLFLIDYEEYDRIFNQP